MGFTWRTCEGLCFLKPESPLTPPMPGSVSSTEGRETRSALGPLVLPRRIPQSHASLPEGHHCTDPDRPQRSQETSVYPGTKFSRSMKIKNERQRERWAVRRVWLWKTTGARLNWQWEILSLSKPVRRLRPTQANGSACYKCSANQNNITIDTFRIVSIKIQTWRGKKKKSSLKGAPRLLKYCWTTEKADMCHLQAFLLKRKEKRKVTLLLGW